MVAERNGISKILRLDMLAFIVQTLVLISALVYGYTKLESKVDETNRRVVDHIEKHSVYLEKDVWDTRNRFVDEKLDKIEKKQDFLIDLVMKGYKR